MTNTETKKEIQSIRDNFKDWEIQYKYEIVCHKYLNEYHEMSAKNNKNEYYTANEDSFDKCLRIIREKLTDSGGRFILLKDGKEIRNLPLSVYEKKKYLLDNRDWYRFRLDDNIDNSAEFGRVLLKENDPNIYFSMKIKDVKQ